MAIHPLAAYDGYVANLQGISTNLVWRTSELSATDAQLLIAAVQSEYVVRYGGPDKTPMHPEQFVHPSGVFLVGYLDGVPVACGGWREHLDDPSAAGEVKRMFVIPSARGRGLARTLLSALEIDIAASGRNTVILETGTEQPEAVGLYRSAGYTPAAPYGTNCASERGLFFTKNLVAKNHRAARS